MVQSVTIEQLQTDLINLRELVKLRLDGMERSQPSVLYTEMFNSVQKQFAERDIRYEAAAVATLAAINAALQAQKETVAAQKVANDAIFTQIESQFTKQIDSLTAMFINMITSIHGRLDRLEK